MRHPTLQLSNRRKQLQRSVGSGLRKHMWLIFVCMSLALLAGCSIPSASAATASSASSTATGHIAGVIDCSSLAQKDFSTISGASTTITSATVVAASGTNPEGCKIDGIISPQIHFELQLPTQQWSGNYFEGGCGGYCGRASESADCAQAFGTGDAIGYNDMGHANSSDNSWGLDETLRDDFAYLANHQLVVAARAIIKTYYGRSPAYSYFDGCSDGGREALIEAQRYPDDFNGIVAGAPALLVGFLNSFYHSWDVVSDLDSNGQNILTSDALTVLHNGAMAACDKLDGVEDGLIVDLYGCKFNPATLACTTTTTTNCLTAAQVEAAQKIYSGPVDEKGEHLYPGGEPYGSELDWSNWIGTKPEGLVTPYLQDLSQPAGSQASTTTALTLPYTSAEFKSLLKTAALYDATNTDLSAFRNHGGKLILYQGLADDSIPPYGTIEYYQALVKQMGGLGATQQFARLFMFPGVYHCGGGYGPDHWDMVTAITNWVEHRIAPSQMLATRYTSDDAPSSGGPSNPPSGSIVRTLPVYPYPEIPRYKGSGSVNDASNYVGVTSRDAVRFTTPWLGQYLFRTAPHQR